MKDPITIRGIRAILNEEERWEFQYDVKRLQENLESEINRLKHNLPLLQMANLEVSQSTEGLLIEDADTNEVLSYIEYGWTFDGNIAAFQTFQPWANDYNFYDLEFYTIKEIAKDIIYTINLFYIAKKCQEA